jgi:hypothetical protein
MLNWAKAPQRLIEVRTAANEALVKIIGRADTEISPESNRLQAMIVPRKTSFAAPDGHYIEPRGRWGPKKALLLCHRTGKEGTYPVRIRRLEARIHHAVEGRCCVVIAVGFYESAKTGAVKQPIQISLCNHKAFADWVMWSRPDRSNFLYQHHQTN